jgi:hypothetical protein
VNFRDGAVVGKLLFSTATPAQLPILANMPAWTANISDPSFCKCAMPDKSSCSMAEQSRQCARSTKAWGPVRLVQFDVAIRDRRLRERSSQLSGRRAAQEVRAEPVEPHRPSG